MKHLYFIRHGQSVMNKKGIFSGRSETPLNQEGRTQAAVSGRLLRSTPIDCIVASPMIRTIETANLIADIIGYSVDRIIINTLFAERDFGPLEGTKYQQNLGDVDGVETIAALIGRAEDGLEFLNTIPADSILLVSHGAIGRALRHCIDPSTPYQPSTGFENGKVVRLL
jgi:broad specificity phosphatase PhoE